MYYISHKCSMLFSNTLYKWKKKDKSFYVILLKIYITIFEFKDDNFYCKIIWM